LNHGLAIRRNKQRTDMLVLTSCHLAAMLAFIDMAQGPAAIPRGTGVYRLRQNIRCPGDPMTARKRFGLSCALSTPFAGDGSIDLGRLTDQARWVMAQGCDGVTVFGTTGESASIALPERRRVLSALAGAGFDPRRRVTAGVTAATVHDAVEQCRAAYEARCRAVLLPPPFFFPDPGDDGVFRWYAAVFERLGPALRDVILYHIPAMTRVGITLGLVAMLKAAFPTAILGVKDSNGQWPDTRRLIAEHGDLQILVGDERHLAQAVRSGAAGSICGIANICPDIVRPLAHDGIDDARVGAVVDAIVAHPVMAAIKALIACRTGDAAWRAMRPPLTALPDDAARALGRQIDMILKAEPVGA
jgi:4-hydroxy-tetrahydrodipicolinate synthase